MFSTIIISFLVGFAAGVVVMGLFALHTIGDELSNGND